MNKTRIIVDSTADLNPNIKDRFSVVPLTIMFGSDEYIDGVTIDRRTFYEKLIESDVIPTTSQASPDSFEKAFSEVTENGDEAVCITVSSALSGTYQSACIAAQEYHGKIFVVDSKNIAIGLGVIAEYALRLADEGMSAEDIAGMINIERDRVRLIAMLDTLEYLKKGGRISRTAAFAGGLLSIKPVLCITDGKIEILGKARGSKQANNLLVKNIEASGGVDFSRPIMLGYTGLTDDLLIKYIADSVALWENNIEELPYAMIGSVVGTHAGPGAVAVAYFAG